MYLTLEGPTLGAKILFSLPILPFPYYYQRFFLFLQQELYYYIFKN